MALHHEAGRTTGRTQFLLAERSRFLQPVRWGWKDGVDHQGKKATDAWQA